MNEEPGTQAGAERGRGAARAGPGRGRGLVADGLVGPRGLGPRRHPDGAGRARPGSRSRARPGVQPGDARLRPGVPRRGRPRRPRQADGARIGDVLPPRAAQRATSPRRSSLRAQGAELLRQAADVSADDSTHPAFARILTELAPDEARILRVLMLEGPQPLVDVRATQPDRRRLAARRAGPEHDRPPGRAAAPGPRSVLPGQPPAPRPGRLQRRAPSRTRSPIRSSRPSPTCSRRSSRPHAPRPCGAASG